MIKKNDEIILDICDVTSEGSGIGRYEGMAIFVPLTAVGDIVRVKILKVKKTYAYAKLCEILTPSTDRTENNCPVFSRCGGCVYRHISYQAECRIKTDKVYQAVKRIGKSDMPPQPILCAENTDRYRNKGQYPINTDGRAGFFAVHSHRIVPCDDCFLQPEIFGKLIKATENWIRENNISIYDETEHKGLFRHIYLRQAEKTDEIMFTAVINGDKLPFFEDLVAALKEVAGEVLKSIQININKAATNVILGDKCVCLWGDPYITDILCGIKVRLSAMSFYQVNRVMAEKLYKKAAQYAEPEGKKILDLYCGAGTIGLSMAKSADSIIGVEIIPEAVIDACYNADANGIRNARFICADATDAAKQLAKEGIKPDVVIVDPPRKGCSEEVISVITEKFKPERVVYVSCDPATLARDINIFVQKGYSLTEYTPADLFPRTSHIETVACIDKR